MDGRVGPPPSVGEGGLGREDPDVAPVQDPEATGENVRVETVDVLLEEVTVRG